MHGQALRPKETVLVKEHPYTLISMNNLAEVLSDQNKCEQAKDIHRQALRLYETASGKGHPYIISSHHRLNRCLLPETMPAFLRSRHVDSKKRSIASNFSSQSLSFLLESVSYPKPVALINGPGWAGCTLGVDYGYGQLRVIVS
jgi:hypothetical protein